MGSLRKPDRPPSTRQIAKIAGVSSAAVSLALRDHPKISLATRERVHRIAAELGYRVDPRMAKLMNQLRGGPLPGHRSTLCAITTVIEGTETTFLRDVIQSARQRADALGYKLEMLWLEDHVTERKDLQRVLYSRGIDGILLLPMKSPRSFARLLEWEKFSVISATYGVLAPKFHRVVPHQFANIQLIYRELARRGYRRIGLVIPEVHDVRSNYSFTSAFAGMCLLGGMEVVPPYVHPGSLPVEIRGWLDRERPDVVLAAGERDCEAIASGFRDAAARKIDFAVLAREEGSTLAGIDEQPAEIGIAAIDLLHSQIQAGEKGIPAAARVTMVEGRWADSPSLRLKVIAKAKGREKPRQEA